MKEMAKKLAELAPKIMGAFHDIGRHQHSRGHPSLTMRQYQALIVLNTNDSLSITEFCQRLNLAASTGTELANRMISMGFFAKSADVQDRRQVTLKVTDEGKQVLEARQAGLIEVFETFLDPFPEADRVAFVRAFEHIWHLIDKNRKTRRHGVDAENDREIESKTDTHKGP